mmetsp:Transcript_20061/g.29895  ORF Transcript_20061/g.29895 Transcript_20061/m.29895 type:complete len:470 (-) Transcript_20061:447-1856(-)
MEINQRRSLLCQTQIKVTCCIISVNFLLVTILCLTCTAMPTASFLVTFSPSNHHLCYNNVLHNKMMKRTEREQTSRKITNFALFCKKRTTPICQLSKTEQSEKNSMSSSSSSPSSSVLKGKISREEAINLANTFQPGNFQPASFATNTHVQTITGFLFRNQHPLFTYWNKNGDTLKSIMSLLRQKHSKENENKHQFWDQRKRFETPDGDFFDVDYKFCEPSSISRGIVIQTHGIESSSSSPTSIDLAKAFLDQDMDVACINFRGCSGEPNRTWRSYHFGFTNDLKQLITETTSRNRNECSPTYSIFLSGFSLGSNVILKLLGELGDSAKDFNIAGAAISCAPYDLQKNEKYHDENPLVRKFYIDSIVKSLRCNALNQVDKFLSRNKGDVIDNGLLSSDDPLIDLDGLRACVTQAEFEDAYTAPIFGFEDHSDYYRQTASCYYLEGIEIPTLILNSADDPFFIQNLSPTL